jgi:hypothetical protein
MKLLDKLLGNEDGISADERPPLHEIRKITVIDEDELEESDTYVEIFMEIHKQCVDEAKADACEPLTIEYHPHRDNYSGLFTLDKEPAVVRILQEERLSDDESRKYRVFGAVVGRLSYYDPR